MGSEPIQTIDKPWVIVHDPGNGKLETILAGEPDADHRSFGLVIADIIGHVARVYSVEKEDVLEWVNRELDSPTTELTRKLNS